jgi:hypothetical protein
MKRKSKIWIYVLIPLGLTIKFLFIVILLNLPEGCKKSDDTLPGDIESNNYITITIPPIQAI